MRLFSAIFITFLFIGCSEEKPGIYDQANYILVRTDSFNNNIGTEYFVFKNDTSRKLVINYWGNGKLMSTGFLYKGKMDGKFEMYDYTGKLMLIDSFIDGKKVFEKSFTEKDTAVKLFKNGKLESFTSVDSLIR